MLANIAQVWFTDVYSHRLLEVAEKRRKYQDHTLPVFFYNQVLFPGAKFALHLFEPRYKLMMKRVVNAERAFLYLPNFANYEANRGDVGLLARLEDCEFLADGRVLMQAKCTERAAVLQSWMEDGTQGLWYARVDRYPDCKLAVPVTPRVAGRAGNPRVRITVVVYSRLYSRCNSSRIRAL
jgi:hypothetical protein